MTYGHQIDGEVPRDGAMRWQPISWQQLPVPHSGCDGVRQLLVDRSGAAKQIWQPTGGVSVELSLVGAIQYQFCSDVVGVVQARDAPGRMKCRGRCLARSVERPFPRSTRATRSCLSRYGHTSMEFFTREMPTSPAL